MYKLKKPSRRSPLVFSLETRVLGIRTIIYSILKVRRDSNGWLLFGHGGPDFVFTAIAQTQCRAQRPRN